MRCYQWILIVALLLFPYSTCKSQKITAEISSGLSYNHYNYMAGGHGSELSHSVSHPLDAQISLGKFVSTRSQVVLKFRYVDKIDVGVKLTDCNCSFNFQSLNYNRFAFEYRFHLSPNTAVNPYIGLNYGLHLASELNYGLGYYDSSQYVQYFFTNNPSNEFVFNRPSFQTLGLIAGLNWSLTNWLFLSGSVSFETTTGGDTQTIFMVYKSPNYTLNDILYHKGILINGSLGFGIYINNL